MKKYSIGIDLGGTKILAGVVEKSTGKVLFEVKNKTKKEKGNKKVSSKIIETLNELFSASDIKKDEISSIGIGLAGQVEREQGVLINAVNLECKDLHIKEILEKEFNIPVYVGNDVDVATFGELNFGAGREHKDIVCIFVGTGIGSSIVKDGKIHLGASQSAGEIGHIIVDLNGRACACGGNGCLEAYASRSAIESRIFGAVKKGRKSIITELCEGKNSISSKHIKKSSASTFIYQIKTKRKIFYSSAIIMVNLFYLFHLLIIFRQTTFTCFFIKRRQIMPCLFHYLYHFIERNAMTPICKC